MGDDFSTLQEYTGSNPTMSKARLISVIREALSESSFTETEKKDEFHNRVIVVGPTEKAPWLSVYDSICCNDEDNQFKLLYSLPEFTGLVKKISANFGPCVTICMDDSCSIAFELFVKGQLLDRYQDNPTIGHLMNFGYWDEVQEKANAGNPEIWIQHLGLSIGMIEKFRQTWPLTGPNISSPKILENTAKLLGWNEHLCRTGYNIGADGVPLPYQMITSHFTNYPESEFTELYFVQ